MLKKLWCWIVGSSCVWKTTHVHEYERQAWGIYVNTPVPRVSVRDVCQTCDTCGAVRVKTQILN